MALLKTMTKSKRGWPKAEMLDFLFVRYRGGVREQTLESIFNQLKDRGVIYAKPTKPHSSIYRWHVNEKRLRELTGVIIT